jgi:hypothetical protein
MIPLVKYTVPGNLVKEPRGTLYKIMEEGQPGALYVQVSRDTEAPQWERLGTLLEIVYERLCHEEHFMNEILDRYVEETNDYRPS